MSLFDKIERNDYESARYAEPSFSYLNRTARIEFDAIRCELERWFSHYPSSGQIELKTRFRSNIDTQHQAAFFELFLHELLSKLGCQVTLHPVVPQGTRTPDFLAKLPNGEPFYIEATLATNVSSAETSARARMNIVYDALDRLIDSPNFFLSLAVEGAPATPPPAKKLASYLNDRLAELDIDEITRLYESGGIKEVPRWHFEHDRWRIEIRAIPKKPEARGKAGVRPIGTRSSAFHKVDHRTAIRDAVIKKAGRYGELDLPYIVAVNALELVDEIDIMEALFGKEQYVVTFPEDETSEPVPPKMSRVLDGVWTSSSGPRYTRVSGVLLATRLSPWNIPRADLRVYHNPWARRLYQSVLTRLPQAVPQDGYMRQIDGELAGVIFGLAPTWPE